MNIFTVEGVEEDGSRTELASFDNSAEARAYLARYVRHEDAGGWNLIEVYQLFAFAPIDDSEAERIAFWARDDFENM